MASPTSPATQYYFNSRASRDSVLERFSDTRRFTRELSKPLEVEDMVIQTVQDVSPTKWHLAHTTWFFETFVLRRFVEGYESPDPLYAYLFNSYYVQAGERYPRPERGLVARPTVSEVLKYRKFVEAKVEEFLGGLPESEFDQVVPVVELGIHHEQQHQELMVTDVKHVLSFSPSHPVYCPARGADRGIANTALNWKLFEEGLFEIGHTGDGFCFDNEMPRHRTFLEAFQLADRLVTNREYLEFMEDGGYREPTLWLDDGWSTAQAEGWEAPLYWRFEDGAWFHYTLNGYRQVDPAEPVCHASFYEADAFARWAGARLPSEAEWEVAASGEKVEGNFVDLRDFHPRPLQTSSSDLNQLFGDVWEWTESAYLGYPGYSPGAGALGEYNGKFMANQVVLKGGSCATSSSHIRPTYRNFFHRDKKWQFSGLRLARNAFE